MKQGSNLYRLYRLSQEDRIIFYKNLIFIAANVSLASLSSLLILTTLRQFSYTFLISSLITLFFFCGFLIVYFLVAKWKYLLGGLLLIDFALLIPAVLSHQYSHFYFWAIGGVNFIFLCFSALRIKSEANCLVHLNWWRIVQKGSWALSLVVLLVFGYLIYLSLDVVQLNPAKALDLILETTAKSNILPYNVSGTIDELSQNIIESQISSSQNINDAMKTLMITQVRNNLSQFFGIPLSGKEKISTIFINWIQQKWQNLSFSVRRLVLLVALLLFINIVGLFNFFFSFILFFVSWLIRELLIAIKLIKLKRIGVEQESLSIT